MNPLGTGTGIDLAALPLVEEFLTRLERDGWLDDAIARFERGDIEGGLRAAEAAFACRSSRPSPIWSTL
jgi:hypothetical protein